MKKTLLMIAMMLSVVMANAQEEHMKFAGIPLNGTIDKFQSKLIAKGYEPNSFINKRLPKGLRAFNGTFIGKDANVSVFYDTSTSVVYGAKVYFDNLNEERANNEFENLKYLLKEKYVDCVYNEETKNDLPTFTISTVLGAIYGYIKKDDDLSGYPYHFTVNLEYYDFKNNDKHNSSVMDDL